MIYNLFVVLILIVSVLMILVVLMQESKGGGLSSQFSSSNQIMGVRKTTLFIEKLTWGLAAIMVVISVICAYVAPKAVTEESVMEKKATQTETTNPTNMPGFGASQPANGTAQPANGATNGTQSAAPAAPAASTQK